MSRKLALIIGNEEYSIRPLINCVNDATCLADVLRKIKNCYVKLKINLTTADMYQSIKNFTESIEHDDFVIFFFAGHGVQWNDQNFLLPCDNNRIINGEDIQRYAINAQMIVNEMAEKNSRVVLFLLDCCHGYSIAQQTLNNTSHDKQIVGLNQMKVPQKTLITFACAAGEVISDQLEISNNGLFMKYLLKHIVTPNVHIETILMRVVRDVIEDTNKKQRPFQISSIVSEDIYLVEDDTTEDKSFKISQNARWMQNGVTIAGGHGGGVNTNQLHYPCGLYVDDDQTIFIADCWNHRVVHWKLNATNGQVVAGGNGQGNLTHQLDRPANLIVDKETDSFIISDWRNRRVIKWSRQSNTTHGEIILENIACFGLTMDDQRFLYISDVEKHEVRRYRIGEKNGTLVAGGNGKGDYHNQLNWPTYLFVDQEYSVYVSDCNNHRVMKWMKGATEGIVVAGGQGNGNSLKQLSYPQGVFVDLLGAVYVAEQFNQRVMRWRKGMTQGEVIVGGNEKGTVQLYSCQGLSFDQHGHLFVVDCANNRVQRFSIEMN